ncbi:transcriptional regulator, AlpA family [Ferrimonas sediminum]|uniref:Transcriptional regulator, AlpA family n=1 Tax=Ferrimonas sediminum TaxID=718193 RepID=A0A1G8UW46_9GAMM|nr:AlpA family phage regulatory protein [Ferrimonas sediminum]SDJ57854.1 transcriptional regulator, AlpA family [Ferrimonas sediminum]
MTNLSPFLVHPDRLIREPECLELTSLSRSQRYQLEKRGRFPNRRQLGNRSVVWRLGDVLEWCKSPETWPNPVA